MKQSKHVVALSQLLTYRHRPDLLLWEELAVATDKNRKYESRFAVLLIVSWGDADDCPPVATACVPIGIPPESILTGRHTSGNGIVAVLQAPQWVEVGRSGAKPVLKTPLCVVRPCSQYVLDVLPGF
eukprot:gene17781-biopygen8356